jgi:arginyl-tRNA--protein-N-Asp/Glu arginylyltransferase
MFDLKHDFSKIINQVQMIFRRSDQSYQRIVCQICNRICYNKKDLKIHLKKEHPDLTSLPTRT